MHQDTHTLHLRQALAADIPALWRVRYAVRENTLEPGRISDEEVRAAIEDTGRGWVIGDEAGLIQAFAIGNAQSGNVWALFVAPEAEGRGFGARLHAVMIDWLWAQGLSILWLSTGPGTRAQGFYERRGWRPVGRTETGDLRLELRRSS
jgi:GNAT superfamily N-acetyltransferase